MKKIKKVFLILLTIIAINCLLVVCGVTGSAKGDIVDYLRYEIENNEVKIVGYKDGIAGELIIPDTIEGYPVTAIGNGAFDLCTTITNLVIPESVKIIEDNAFYTCTKLKKAVLPDSLTELPHGLFGHCYSLEEVNIPDGIQVIPSSAFASCYSLSEIEIPDSVVAIGDAAFSGTMLKEINLPDGLQMIGEHAFLCCYKLDQIKIPAGVKYIDDYAFYNCMSLEKVEFLSGLLEIGYLSFSNCYSLQNVVFPDTLKKIGEESFSYCLSLEEITIPKSVEVVEKYAFGCCNSLKKIHIENYSTKIRTGAFAFTICELNIDVKDFIKIYIDCYDNGIIMRNPDGTICGVTEYPDPENIDEILKLEFPIVSVKDAAIYGYSDSTAHNYAKKNNIQFIPYDCVHEYTDNIVVIKESTYFTEGKKGYICINCGDSYNVTDIPCQDINSANEKHSVENNVSILYPDGSFDGEVVFDVISVPSDQAFQLVSHKEGNYKVTMFDINAVVEGELVNPNGTVLVKIPLPKGYNQNKCTVYYVSEFGTMEELKTYHNKDGYVYFETDHFSYYAILENIEEENNQNSLSFIDKIVIFLKRIVDFFKKLFFEAVGMA